MNRINPTIDRKKLEFLYLSMERVLYIFIYFLINWFYNFLNLLTRAIDLCYVNGDFIGRIICKVIIKAHLTILIGQKLNIVFFI